MKNSGESKNRHILISLDESENSRRALVYAADFLEGMPDVRISLLHIISEPPEDYFNSKEERRKWTEDHKKAAEKLMAKYRHQLMDSGISEKDIDTIIEIRLCSSIAECIMDVQNKLGYCTIVVGRRGISKKEEFMFGSTSSRLLHSQKHCAIWVVE